MRYFRIKNFELLQHYKDRSPPWIKLYNDLLEDYVFSNLPDASKLHHIMICLLASRNNNYLPYDIKWISQRINANSPVNLEILEKAGLIEIISSENPGKTNTSDERYQDAIKALQEKENHARPERETEGERETETERDILSQPPAATSSNFEKFWKTYPRREKKKQAHEVWKRKKLDPQVDLIIADVEMRKLQHQPWLQGFVPHATSYLNGERWSDEITTTRASPASQGDSVSEHNARVIAEILERDKKNAGR